MPVPRLRGVRLDLLRAGLHLLPRFVELADPGEGLARLDVRVPLGDFQLLGKQLRLAGARVGIGQSRLQLGDGALQARLLGLDCAEPGTHCVLRRHRLGPRGFERARSRLQGMADLRKFTLEGPDPVRIGLSRRALLRQIAVDGFPQLLELCARSARRRAFGLELPPGFRALLRALLRLDLRIQSRARHRRFGFRRGDARKVDDQRFERLVGVGVRERGLEGQQAGVQLGAQRIDFAPRRTR